MYRPAYDADEVPDEYHEEEHKRLMHRRRRSLPPGHPDAPEEAPDENEGDAQ